MDLDALFTVPGTVAPFLRAIAAKIAPHDAAIVCGPLTGGAFLAQMMAVELGVGFSFAERRASTDGRSVAYAIPRPLREAVRDKRVALVDDAISAGSAVRATLTDLESCGASVVVIGALLLVGDRAQGFASEKHLPLEWLDQVGNPLWEPSECPLCASGVGISEP